MVCYCYMEDNNADNSSNNNKNPRDLDFFAHELSRELEIQDR